MTNGVGLARLHSNLLLCPEHSMMLVHGILDGMEAEEAGEMLSSHVSKSYSHDVDHVGQPPKVLECGLGSDLPFKRLLEFIFHSGACRWGKPK